ncbi:hypothetical protein HMPREF9544_00068 [Escherichia coli MS 153-1]|nr:hypothetical protein HMPREF9549_03183 [Escherichia coli MS 185-1]EFJ93336.1 hypothetical protein HMPREF9531_01553 [Escherichia coli MS 45-1]EFU54809.1 hypothetical protein HMPREF9544_00068 [Escherichia coli MS 153-1]ESD40490.1 hypothetical protein HMPREF1603_01294 [Escherichia coli 907892]
MRLADNAGAGLSDNKKHHRSHPCLTHRSSERPGPILSGMVGLAIPVCFIHPAALLIVMESSSPPGADTVILL